MHWRRKWQPTPVFLPGESQGWGSLVGCRLWGRTESDTTEAVFKDGGQSSMGMAISETKVAEPSAPILSAFYCQGKESRGASRDCYGFQQ